MKMSMLSVKAIAIASVLGLGLTGSALADGHTAAEVGGDAVESAVEETLSQAETTPVAQPAIADIVNGVDEFSTLAAALEAAELTEALMGEGPFTVFAPPNEAFAALPEGVVEALLLPENKDLLTAVLTYHVVPGAVMSGDLSTGSVETLEGSALPVVVDTDGVTVGDSSVIAVDLPASNGVVHVIDAVLVPEEVATELASRLAAAEAEAPVVEEAAPAEAEAPMVEEAAPPETTTPAEPIRGLW